MTACSNKRGRAGRVITAALVGALSVGAPAVALAANGGVDLLAAAWNTEATVTKAENGAGTAVSGDLSKVTLEKGQWLVPTEVENSMGDKTAIDADDYVLNYYKNGALVATTDEDWIASYPSVKTPAEYFKTAQAVTYSVKIVKGDAANGSDRTGDIYFKIAADEAEDVTLSLKDELTYTGAALTPVFVDEDGNEYANGGTYTISYKMVDSTDDTFDGTVKGAGTYIATVKEGEDVVDVVTFEVAKYDIASDELSYADGENGSTLPGAEAAFIKSATGLSDASDIAAIYVAGPDGKAVDFSDTNFFGKDSGLATGKYTVTLRAAASENLVAGTNTVSFYVLNDDFSDDMTVKYDGKDTASGIAVDLAKGEEFDASKVTVEAGGTTYKGDQLELTFTKDDKAVSADDVAAAANGDKFEMTVRVKPVQDWATNAWSGGTTGTATEITFKGFEVSKDTDLAFYVDGKVAGDSAEVTYDGTDQLGKVSVTVRADGKTYAEGTDYTLEVKDADGEVLTEVVDASDGAYTITVKPITFSFTGTSSDTFKLTVKKAEISGLKNFVDGSDEDAYDFSKDESLYYTGSELEVPAAQYDADDDAARTDFVALDPSLYEVSKIEYSVDDEDVTSGSELKSLKDAGYYKVTIALTEEAAKNYTLSDGAFIVQVAKKANFSDVAADKWYAQAVYAAKSLGYVNGVSGTELFMPEATISRADAVCILFNMANGTNPVDFSYTEDGGYVTGFSDVQGNEYFAKALAWAHAMGIANGNGGSFMPYDKITREEFAALMANYAKAKGDYVAPSAGAMDGISDADGVSGWASEVVAWAVENGVMGNKGSVYAPSTITRAEVAAMAVNYQPAKL